MMIHRTRRLCFLTMIAATCSVPAVAYAERWTDLRGRQTIEARLVGKWDDQVVLEMSDGRRVAVPIDQLRAESRIQAQELATKLEAKRAQQIEQLQQQAATAAAPAPTPLPRPQATPAYQPPAENLSPEQSVQHMVEQLSAGHLRALLDAMPPSYRQDIDELVQIAAKKVSPDSFNAVAGVLHDVGNTVESHQNWVFSHPRFAKISDESKQAVRETLLAIAGFLNTGFDPQNLKLEDLQTKPFSQWLAEFDERTAPYLAPLMKDIPEMIPDMTYSEPKEGVVTVTQEIDGKETPVSQIKKVDGYWVQASMAQDWDKMIEDAKSSLAAFEDDSLGGGMMAAMIPGMVQPILQPLKSAADEDQFHVAMESLVSQASGWVQMVPNLVPKSGLPGRGNAMAGYGVYNGAGPDDSMESSGDFNPYAGSEMDDGSGDGQSEDLDADPYGGNYGGG